MKGVSSFYKPGEVDVKALLAGNDVLLFPEDVPKAIQMIETAIKNGEITMAEIEKRCLKILKAKEWTGLNHLKEIDFYQSLKETNPSPFLFYFHFPNFVLTGSSPEIMVAVNEGKITIKPLAGTRKRGSNEEEDAKLSQELLADPKEIAEHLMLIDLGRHDVGSVAENGSVEVVKKMQIEYYSHVMHISSTVEGRLKQGCDAVDALMAGFPAGTVSGAPKIRAMEIIQELEEIKRSFYSGCVGFFASNGNMETCITLRSALIKDGKIHLQAGAGVVFDSVPKLEYQECLNKMQALIKAYENIT